MPAPIARAFFVSLRPGRRDLGDAIARRAPRRPGDEIDAERDGIDADEIGRRGVLAEQEPSEQKPERRHQEMIGAGRGCPRHRAVNPTVFFLL
jgi:hypothetical protein